MIIKRDKYVNQLIRKRENGLIKIITGIRRSGKSFLLFNLFHDYLNSIGIDDEYIIEISLDDEVSAKYRNPLELSDYIRNRMSEKDKEYYIFIDEIQQVKEIRNQWLEDPNEKIGFVDVLLGLQKIKNADIYITGSNSKMLSSEIVGMKLECTRFLLVSFIRLIRRTRKRLGKNIIPMGVCQESCL